ncbi:MAG: cytochrome c-type biogenesis protein [Acidimicrobiales bacterium]
MTRRLSWVGLAIVLVAALGVAGFGDRSPRNLAERVETIAATIRCPTCQSQSAADSDAPASEAIRQEIRTRLGRGETSGQIRTYFASRYGESILLTPSSSGVTALVWILPVVALVLAASGVGWAFLRWRRWGT